MKSKEYLQEIRRAPGLVRAVLRKIAVEGRKATFFLVTDVAYTQDDIAHAQEVTARYAEGLTAEVRIMKSVPSETEVGIAVREILKRRAPTLSAFVREGDIIVTVRDKGGNVTVCANEAASANVEAERLSDGLSEELGRSYCGTWLCRLDFVKRATEEVVPEAPPEEYVLAPRFFDVTGYSPIDGAKPARALYIADLTKEGQGITVCGTISRIEERETKNGKPYFSLIVGDGTGSLRSSYFTKKATLEKVRALREGMSVCLTGDNEFYNGGLSFRTKSIDLGSAPEGFVPEERPARPYPAQYRTVFPSPAADLVQGDLFSTSRLPAEFYEETFVVFDLETTGLSLGNTMDKIIEIGAVKIEKGSISEKFSTFVACPTKLPPDIITLTGITDEMLEGAPELEAVLADFYKFTEGAALVAHNTQFDCRVIRYYGDTLGYRFGQRQYDTLLLAQRLLPLKNYKLNTVAEHFGFTFRHHRAYEDAFVTAKIFMELVRMEGKLPL